MDAGSVGRASERFAQPFQIVFRTSAQDVVQLDEFFLYLVQFVVRCLLRGHEIYQSFVYGISPIISPVVIHFPRSFDRN